MAAPIATITEDDVLLPVTSSAKLAIQRVNVVRHLHGSGPARWGTHTPTPADAPTFRRRDLRRSWGMLHCCKTFSTDTRPHQHRDSHSTRADTTYTRQLGQHGRSFSRDIQAECPGMIAKWLQ